MTPARKLGRRPPKNHPCLRLGSYLTHAVPAHPAASDHFGRVTDWGLYDNDRYGDCGPAAVGNTRKIITTYLAGREQSPSQADVFDLYRRSGNPDFDPVSDTGDDGVDMQTMCEALTTGGIGGTKALGFAQVDVTNPDETRAAIAIFGSVLLGVNLTQAQQSQTDYGLWDYKKNSPDWGGHAVVAGSFTSASHGPDVYVISWGQPVGVTDAFWQHQVEEAWVLIWPEHTSTTQFMQGIDRAALAADYQELTGRTLPIPTDPGPVPQPAPVTPVPIPMPPPPVPVPGEDPDQVLAHAVRSWLAAKGM